VYVIEPIEIGVTTNNNQFYFIFFKGLIEMKDLTVRIIIISSFIIVGLVFFIGRLFNVVFNIQKLLTLIFICMIVYVDFCMIAPSCRTVSEGIIHMMILFSPVFFIISVGKQRKEWY